MSAAEITSLVHAALASSQSAPQNNSGANINPNITGQSNVDVAQSIHEILQIQGRPREVARQRANELKECEVPDWPEFYDELHIESYFCSLANKVIARTGRQGMWVKDEIIKIMRIVLDNLVGAWELHFHDNVPA